MNAWGVKYLFAINAQFEENEDVEGWRAGRSVAYCKACDRELKRATQGLMLSEEQSIGSFRSNKKNMILNKLKKKEEETTTSEYL